MVKQGLLGGAAPTVFRLLILMRAGPSGEERRTRGTAVSVSPQCPQEIGLPTLPRTVFRDAAISSEHILVFRPETLRS